MPVSGAWPNERFEALKELIAQGLSAGAIADTLGISRNAVIGKVHRTGDLAFKRGPGAANEDERKRRRNDAARNRRQRLHKEEQAVPKYRTEPQPLTELEVEIAAHAVTFEELAEHHCRWPISGADAVVLYCGGDAVAGLPYCARHCWMAYRAPERRRA